MVQFIEACIAPANIVATVLLSLCVLYWLMVLMGAVKIRTLELVVEVEEQVQASGDKEGDVVAEPKANIIVRVLTFLNFRCVPVMVLITIAILCMWLIAIWLHAYTGRWSVALQVLLLLPYLSVGLLVGKLSTMPFRIRGDRRREEQRKDRSDRGPEKDAPEA